MARSNFIEIDNDHQLDFYRDFCWNPNVPLKFLPTGNPTCSRELSSDQNKPHFFRTCFARQLWKKTMAGFPLRSDFDRHLKTFLVLVQCKRRVNLSREVTAADLVDLRRTLGLFREVVPLLRAELDELKVKLLGPGAVRRVQNNPFLEPTSVAERKKKFVTFADDLQTNPFLEYGVGRQTVTAQVVGEGVVQQSGAPTETDQQTDPGQVVGEGEVQQSGAPTETVQSEDRQSEARQVNGTDHSFGAGFQRLEATGCSPQSKETVNSINAKVIVQQSGVKTSSEVTRPKSRTRRGRRISFQPTVPEAKQKKPCATADQFIDSPCYYCGGRHVLCRCWSFGQLRLAKRLEFVQQMELCINCFSQRHLVDRCRDIPRCMRCSEMHHTLMHRFD